MVLASQSSRQSPRGRFSSNMTGKRQRTRRIVNAGFGVAAVLGFGWLMWSWMRPAASTVPVRTGEVAPMVPADTRPPEEIPLVNANATEPKDDTVSGTKELAELAKPPEVIGAPAKKDAPAPAPPPATARL